MRDPTLEEGLQLVAEHYAAGRLEPAESVCHQILKRDPQCVGALHWLGLIVLQAGKHETAAGFFRQAIDLDPRNAEMHRNLGVVYQSMNRLDEAIVSYRQAIALRPDFIVAHTNLGFALIEKGEFDQGVECLRRAVELKPGDVDAVSNLGVALQKKGEFDRAIDCYRQALAHQPQNSTLHYNLGVALEGQGKMAEAISSYRKAIAIAPSFMAYNNLGRALQDLGQLDEAIECLQKALAIAPDHLPSHVNLGNAFRQIGELDQSFACYRRAMLMKQADSVIAHQCLLWGLHFHPDWDAQNIYDEHLRWQERYERPLLGFHTPHANERSTNRRLRIGYVSPDFRDHPVGRFLLPLLASHNREQFEIFCYAALRYPPDSMTDTLMSHADQWRSIALLSDEKASQLIRDDRIDILVDLTMHMADNRLLLFARKPAPIQVTYLAYCSTTGLKSVDYRLTDAYLDPPELGDKWYTEQSIRLTSYWCYQPAYDAGNATPLPACSTGKVTFGCLNNFSKVTPPVLAAWAELLRRVSNSRLIMHSPEGRHRQRLQHRFAQEGIDPTRLMFVPHLPLASYFAHYAQIDVALDPFPYGGGTTTCDALWMGVPVVTLSGKTAAGRGGVSILSNLGLKDLIAYTPEQYVSIAVGLANDLPRLSIHRATLRETMQQSPLMDAKNFARNVEEAYRNMWRAWCDRG